VDLPSSSLVFSTEGSSIFEIDMAVWSEDGALIEGNAGSEIMVYEYTLPAVFYVGGSQFATYFLDDFGMIGNPFGPNETGTITFSLNNEIIGSKELGDEESTGLPEFALFRVGLGASGEIAFTEDVPPVDVFACSVADYFASVENCTLDLVCELFGAQFQLDNDFECGLNDDGGLTFEVIQPFLCYDDLSQVSDGGSIVILDDDMNTIGSEGIYCEQTVYADAFDSVGNYVSSSGLTTFHLPGTRTHTFTQEYPPVSCDNENAVEYFILGDETFCYAEDDCSSLFVNGQACTGACAACEFVDLQGDCSNIDESLVQGCDDFDMFEQLFMYFDGLESSITMSPVNSTMSPASAATDSPVEAPVLAPMEVPVNASVDTPVDAPVEAPVEESAPVARSNAEWTSAAVVIASAFVLF